METRAKNKTAHPGKIVKTGAPRRTSDEIQQEQEAKATAKAIREAEKQGSIDRTAKFELVDMANEGQSDATPRPPFTPKPWPPARNKKKTNRVLESSDVEISGDDPDFGATSAALAASAADIEPPTDESSTESISVAPPTKKRKIQATEKATRTVKESTKVAKKVTKAVAPEDEETPKPPKPRKGKAKVRDEIDGAAKKMEDEVRRDRYGEMVKSMSTTSQLQGAGGGKLKREGAIADINSLYKKAKLPSNPDQTVSGNNNPASGDLMDIDKGDSTTSQKKQISAINKWASAIPTTSGAKSTATSQAPKSTSSRGKADIPSLTCGTSHRSYAPSVLSNNVKIFSGQSSDAAVKAEPAVSIYNNGGLSDNEEIKGEEREFAIKSPPKGKKRITSEELIVQTRRPSKMSETAKKTRNEELPDWVNQHWFRHIFVTTYMAFVGQTADPWDVPVKQSIEVMQKIFDATNDRIYEITTSTSIYKKTVQRLADSWRNAIGSTGIAVLMAFFDAPQVSEDDDDIINLQNSDEERINFAKFYLEDLRFLYKDSADEDKKKWKGLFRSPFVLQAFAAHLGAIEGSVKVPEVHGPDKPTPVMAGALGLAAASVERALILVATGTLTIEMAHGSKGKTIPLPRTVNRSTGKESTRQTGFSDIAWGKATRGYAKSARSLTDVKFDAIVQDAKEFLKPIRSRNKTTEAMEIINIDDDDDDERAHLVDNESD